MWKALSIEDGYGRFSYVGVGVPHRFGAGAVGEVNRLLRSAFTSHCVTARGRGAVGTAESSLCAASAAAAALALTMHLARHRTIRNWLHTHKLIRSLSSAGNYRAYPKITVRTITF